MSEPHPWYDMTRAQQADMIDSIAWNLTLGDDQNIDLSNIGQDEIEAAGIECDDFSMILERIASAWRNK